MTNEQAVEVRWPAVPAAAEPLSVAAVESRWPAVLELLGRRRKVTALLRDARVVAVQADTVTLEFDYAFHAEQVEMPENRLVTEKALQRVFGRPLHVRVVVKGVTERSTDATRIKEIDEQHDTLDWADVEAWIKSNNKKLKPFQNDFDGYNIDCPVPTHQLKDDRLSVWPMKDGNVYVRCFGDCNHQDVRAAIAKEINTPPNREDTEPLDQLDEQTAEYWKNQATEAKAELEREREARLAAEKTVEKVQDKLDKSRRDYKSVNAKLSRRDEKIQGLEAEMFRLENERNQARNNAKEVAAAQAKHAQERDARIAAETERDQERAAREAAETERDQAYDIREAAEAELETRTNSEITAGQLQKSVNELSAENTRLNKVLEELRDEKEEEVRSLRTRLDAAEEERGQRDQRISDLEPKALTFDFIAAWGDLEDELEPLKKELIQVYLRSGRSYPQAERQANIHNQLDRALEKGYINKDQYLDLKNMQPQRNNVAHRGHQLKSKLADAYLDILEPVLEQLGQHSPQTRS